MVNKPVSFILFSIACGAIYLPPAVLNSSFLRSVILRNFFPKTITHCLISPYKTNPLYQLLHCQVRSIVIAFHNILPRLKSLHHCQFDFNCEIGSPIEPRHLPFQALYWQNWAKSPIKPYPSMTFIPGGAEYRYQTRLHAAAACDYKLYSTSQCLLPLWKHQLSGYCKFHCVKEALFFLLICIAIQS